MTFSTDAQELDQLIAQTCLRDLGETSTVRDWSILIPNERVAKVRLERPGPPVVFKTYGTFDEALCEREALDLLSSQSEVTCPEVLAGPTVTPLGIALLMSFVPGTPVSKSEQTAALNNYLSGVGLLRAVHTSASVDGFGRPNAEKSRASEFLDASQQEALQVVAAARPAISEPFGRALSSARASFLASMIMPVLCHGDLHLPNMHFEQVGTSQTVTTFLDFEKAMFAPASFDVAQAVCIGSLRFGESCRERVIHTYWDGRPPDDLQFWLLCRSAALVAGYDLAGPERVGPARLRRLDDLVRTFIEETT